MKETHMKKRVVITGMGVISPVGTGIDAFWNSLCDGVSGIGKITQFDADNMKSRIAGEVDDFDPIDYMGKKEAKRMDRFTQFAVAASGMAIKDAGLDLEVENKDRIGVMIGSGVGGITTLEKQFKVLHEKGCDRVSPFLIPMMIANMGAGLTAVTYGLRGPNVASVTACASSTNAIGEAFRTIQGGYADAMIAGGAEAPITPIAISGFIALKAMSTNNDEPKKASKPFDLNRDGFVISEGSAILVMETLEHAQKRGARIYAEIIGYGASCDAYHMVAPDPEGSGAINAMNASLDDAGLSPDDVDYINAHATSTPPGDIAENLAIKKVFKQHAHELAISATKSMTGHLLGAAGALESMVCILAIVKGIIPPTINYEQPDPECDLDYVPNVARKAEVNIAISNSFGFGGHNATLVFKKYQDA